MHTRQMRSSRAGHGAEPTAGAGARRAVGSSACCAPQAPLDAPVARSRPLHRRANGAMLLGVGLLLLAQPTMEAASMSSMEDAGVCAAAASRTCASTTSAVGAGLSLATAGVPSIFTILARDSNFSAVVNSPASFHVDWSPAPASSEGQPSAPHTFTAVAYPQPCPDSRGGCIAAVVIENAGAGCFTGGELSATGGGGGAGFSAVFTHTGGAVSGVSILNAGFGYTSSPTLRVSAGGTGCTGFVLRAIVHSGAGHQVPYLVTRSGRYDVVPSLVSQGGVEGFYYNNVMLSGVAARQRIDAGISFDWGPGLVTPQAKDMVSIRWQGKLRAMDSEETMLTVKTDAASGIRLWLQDKLLIDRPTPSLQSSGDAAAGGAPQCSTAELSNFISSHVSSQDRIINCESCPGYNWKDGAEPGVRALAQNLSLEFPLHPSTSQLPTYMKPRSAVGVALNGVLILNDDVDWRDGVGGGGKLDSCGGHVGASGLYAYIREPSCLGNQQHPQLHAALLGFMLDGVPIYASMVADADDASSHADDGLDECGGHVDSQLPFYHYHFRSQFPHTPACLKGCVGEKGLRSMVGYAAVQGQPAPCTPAKIQHNYTSLSTTSWVKGSGGNRVTIEAGDSLVSASAAVNLTAGSLYNLKLEYTHESGSAQVWLSWRNRYRAARPVPSRQLFYTHQVSIGTVTLLVEPGAASAAASSLTLWREAIVGIISMQLVVRDEFGNVRSRGTDSQLLQTSVVPSPALGTADAPPVLSGQGNGSYVIRVEVQTSGAWTANVLLNTSHVQGSPMPLSVKAGPFLPSTSVLIGNVANGRQVSMTRGLPAVFSIQAKDTFGNNVTNDETLRFNVLIRQKGVLHRVCTVEPHPTGLHSATCQHASPGTYTLEVLSGDRHVANSPFQVQVAAGYTSASQSYAVGNGLTVATAGVGARFTIQTRDALAHLKTTGGDSFESSLNLSTHVVAVSVADTSDTGSASAAWCGASVTATNPSYPASRLLNDVGVGDSSLTLVPSISVGIGPGSYLRIDSEVMLVTSTLSNVLQISRGQAGTNAGAHLAATTVEALYADCGSGTYVGTFTATRSGLYDLNVQLGGLYSIQRMPHRVSVAAAGLCAARSVATGSGLTLATAGRQARYTVTARDVYDNDVDHLDGKMLEFRVFSSGLGVVAKGNVEGSSDVGEDPGKYFVQYTAVRGSPVRCFHSIQIDGQDILGNLVAFHTVVVAPAIASVYSSTDLSTSAVTDVGTNLTFSITARDGFNDVRRLNSIVHMELSGNLSVSIPNGAGKALSITCTAPCKGSGLAASYEVSNGVIKYVWLTSGGCGYDSMHPPTISDSTNAPGAIFRPVVHSKLQEWSVTARGAQLIGGLAATYYDSVDMTGPVAAGFRTSVDFSDACIQGTYSVVCQAPSASLSDGEGFSVRWAGLVQPPAGELYTFQTLLSGDDERVKLWVNNQLIIDSWSSLDTRTPSGTVAMGTANGFYDVEIDYKEVEGDDGLTLKWASASVSTEPVPSQRLYSGSHTVEGVVVDNGDGSYTASLLTTQSGRYTAYLELTTQGGLQGQYFPNPLWTDDGAVRHRVDTQLDMDWNLHAPMNSFPSDHFTVRWTGMIRPPVADYYTFYIQADDSVKLWFNRAKIFSSEGLAARQEWSVVVTQRLSPSALYPIRLDYREHQVSARIRLLWSSVNTPKQVVPSSSLFQNDGPIGSTPVASPLVMSCASSSSASHSVVESSLRPSLLMPGSLTHSLSVGDGITVHIGTRDPYGNVCEGPDGNNTFFAVRGTYREKKGQIVRLEVTSSGSDYINGKLVLAPAVAPGFDAAFSTTANGSISTVKIGYPGAPFAASTFSIQVEPVYMDTEIKQAGTVSKILVEGTKVGNYATGALNWTCGGVAGCTGRGLSGECKTVNGTVTEIRISDHGSGFNKSAPPLVSCPSGSGQVFRAKVAGGAIIAALRSKAEEKTYCTRTAWCSAQGEDMTSSVAEPSMGVGAANHSKFRAQLNMTRAGLADITTSFATTGGLSATYYLCLDPVACDAANATSARAAKHVVAEVIDFSSAEAGTDASVTWPSRTDLAASNLRLRDPAPFYVRWSGWMMPRSSHATRRFRAHVHGADERVKVWVDNQLVVDAWHSLASTQLTWSQQVNAYVPHTLQVEYKDWSGAQGLTLLDDSNVPLSAQELFHELAIDSAHVEVAHGALCAAQSFVWGSAISVATVSQPASFSLLARDRFGNICDDSHQWFLDVSRNSTYVGPDAKIPVSLASTAPCLYEAGYTVTASGAYYISVRNIVAGGLTATYYDTDQLTSPLSSIVDEQMNFKSTNFSSAGMWPRQSSSSLNASMFSVRWRGWIKPTLSALYTFRTEPLGDAQRVKLWIDNSLLINEWPSLSTTSASAIVQLASETLHELVVEYKEREGPRTFGLVWDTALLDWPLWQIPSTVLYSAQHVAASPFPLTSHVGIPGSGSFCQ